MKTILACLFLTFSNFGYGQAEIKFDSIEYTIHNVRQGVHSKSQIHFRNIGNAPLIIESVQTDIPVADWPKMPISPGEDGYITIYFPASCIGRSRNAIYVSTNTKESKDLIFITFEVVANDKERVINGVVRDSTGQPITFVAVRRLGSKFGTQTDVNGTYSILAKPTDTLMFSCTGYFEQKILASRDKLDVVILSRPFPISVDYGLPIIRKKYPLAPIRKLTKKERRAVNKTGKQ